MYFTVNALEPAEYEAWVAEQTGGATTADATEGEDATDTADSEEGTEMSEEAA
jgi:heme/copper-type cytochrome/quinol oxidase subunit 2